MARFVPPAKGTSSRMGLVALGLGCVLLLAIGCQQDPIEQAAKRLESGTPDERVAAVQVLIQSRSLRLDDRAIATIESGLRKALEDESAAVRRVTAQGVVKSGRPDLIAAAVEAMRKDLGADDAATRKAAAAVLATVETPAATDGLIDALRSSDPDVRVVAAKAIDARSAQLATADQIRLLLVQEAPQRVAEMGAGAIPTLRELLDADPQMHNAAATAIGLIGDQETIPRAVAVALDDLNADQATVRATAVNALGALGDPKAIPSLQNLAEHDPDANVRAGARVAVYVLQKDTVALVRALEDPDPVLQTIAIRGIRSVPDKRAAVEPLIRLLRTTTNRRVADEVIATIGTCGPLASQPILDAFQQEPEWSLRLRLAKALNEPRVRAGLDNDQQVTLYQLWDRETNDSVREELANVLRALET